MAHHPNPNGPGLQLSNGPGVPLTGPVDGPGRTPGCELCADPTYLPSHRGSVGCESGSIASGGTRSHCTCDRCF